MKYRKLVISLFLLTSLCTNVITGGFVYPMSQTPTSPRKERQSSTKLRHDPDVLEKDADTAKTPSDMHGHVWNDREYTLQNHQKDQPLLRKENATHLPSMETRAPQPVQHATVQHATVQPTSQSTYWVDAGANGPGTEANPAGNITYVLNNKVSSSSTDIINVKPGTYNTTIGETFPLYIDTAHVTLTSTTEASATIINGTGSTTGIHVTTNNITINDFSITNNEWGIGLEDSSHNTITNNTITNNSEAGIGLDASSHNTTVSDNTITNNDAGIGLAGSNTTISDNTITYNTGTAVGLDASSHNTTVSDNTITNNDAGIGLAGSNTTISDNTITNNNNAGVGFAGSNYNTTVSDNTITNNDAGVGLAGSSHNATVLGNIITNNEGYGIAFVEGSTDNLVYRNNFIGNDVNAMDTVGGNAFNSSTIGNYWSDYPGSDADGDGIGDTPYPIPGGEGSKDYLPSIEPFTSFDLVDPSLSISSPSNGTTISSREVTVEWSGDDDVGIDHYAVQLDDGTWTNVDTATSHTFTELADDDYTVTVKAVDGMGNTATDTVTFTVNTEAGGEEDAGGLSPIILAGIGVGIAIIIVAVAVYFLKTRKS